MHLLDGVIRPYAWGSRTALAELRGLPTPSPHPEAELWFGAHPAAPAPVGGGADDQTLLDVVDADPRGQLGGACADRYQNRLPFLVKVLAADEPLSLQAHPSLEQAKDGFARENAQGLEVGAPNRNYRDDNHKPELVVAITEFELLAGFRNVTETVDLLRALQVPELDAYLGMLAGQPDSQGLRALFTTWITLPESALATLIPAVIDGAIAYLASTGNGGHSRPRSGHFWKSVRTIQADSGVLAVLLLNRISLRPGEGLFFARRQPAFLPGRYRYRGDGQLRQRPAGWSDTEARGCARTPPGPRFHARLAVRGHPDDAHTQCRVDLPDTDFGVPVVDGGTRRHRHPQAVIDSVRCSRAADPAVHVRCDRVAWCGHQSAGPAGPGGVAGRLRSGRRGSRRQRTKRVAPGRWSPVSRPVWPRRQHPARALGHPMPGRRWSRAGCSR